MVTREANSRGVREGPRRETWARRLHGDGVGEFADLAGNRRKLREFCRLQGLLEHPNEPGRPQNARGRRADPHHAVRTLENHGGRERVLGSMHDGLHHEGST